MSAADIETELARRAALLAREAQAADPDPLMEMVVFRLGGETYAIETRYLRAVSRFGDMARLPGARSALHGVTLFRGELLTVIDLRGPLGLSGSALNDLNRILVVGNERAEFGILADRLDGIVSLRVRDVSPVSMVGQSHSRLVKGLTRDAVIVLDGDKLLSFNLGENHALDR